MAGVQPAAETLRATPETNREAHGLYPSSSGGEVSLSGVSPLLQCKSVHISARVRPKSRPVDGIDPCGRLELQPTLQSLLVWPLPSENHGHRQQVEELEPKRFTFDALFGPDSTQAEVHRVSTSAAVADVLSGKHATVLVYGQTGSGKTYTVFGPDTDAQSVGAKDASQLGLIPRALHDLFERTAVRSMDACIPGADGDGSPRSADNNTAVTEVRYDIAIKYIQLYQDVWLDLLSEAGPGPGSSSNGMKVDPRLTPAHASVQACTDVRAALHLLHRGSKRKVVAATAMNSQSSRGHTVFQILVTRTMRYGDGSGVVSYPATLTFIDLAGSERLTRLTGGAVAGRGGFSTSRSNSSTGTVPGAASLSRAASADAATLAEARFINKSLHTLGVCLAAVAASALKLAQVQEAGESDDPWKYRDAQAAAQAAFIPWRSSKLTRFLQSCLADPDPANPSIGRQAGLCRPSTISLIVCLSPTDASISESVSTLIFASRAKAFAAAMAGDTASARMLLSDSTFRRKQRTENGAEDTTDDADADRDDTPAAAAHSNPNQSKTNEIEEVLDRQRTHIGSLMAQYEALLASHTQLQSRLAAAEAEASMARQEASRASAAASEAVHYTAVSSRTLEDAAVHIAKHAAASANNLAHSVLELEEAIAMALESGDEPALREAVEIAARLASGTATANDASYDHSGIPSRIEEHDDGSGYPGEHGSPDGDDGYDASARAHSHHFYYGDDGVRGGNAAMGVSQSRSPDLDSLAGTGLYHQHGSQAISPVIEQEQHLQYQQQKSRASRPHQSNRHLETDSLDAVNSMKDTLAGMTSSVMASIATVSEQLQSNPDPGALRGAIATASRRSSIQTVASASTTASSGGVSALPRASAPAVPEPLPSSSTMSLEDVLNMPLDISTAGGAGDGGVAVSAQQQYDDDHQASDAADLDLSVIRAGIQEIVDDAAAVDPAAADADVEGQPSAADAPSLTQVLTQAPRHPSVSAAQLPMFTTPVHSTGSRRSSRHSIRAPLETVDEHREPAQHPDLLAPGTGVIAVRNRQDLDVSSATISDFAITPAPATMQRGSHQAVSGARAALSTLAATPAAAAGAGSDATIAFDVSPPTATMDRHEAGAHQRHHHAPATPADQLHQIQDGNAFATPSPPSFIFSPSSIIETPETVAVQPSPPPATTAARQNGAGPRQPMAQPPIGTARMEMTSPIFSPASTFTAGGNRDDAIRAVQAALERAQGVLAKLNKHTSGSRRRERDRRALLETSKASAAPAVVVTEDAAVVEAKPSTAMLIPATLPGTAATSTASSSRRSSIASTATMASAVTAAPIIGAKSAPSSWSDGAAVKIDGVEAANVRASQSTPFQHLDANTPATLAPSAAVQQASMTVISTALAASSDSHVSAAILPEPALQEFASQPSITPQFQVLQPTLTQPPSSTQQVDVLVVAATVAEAVATRVAMAMADTMRSQLQLMQMSSMMMAPMAQSATSANTSSAEVTDELRSVNNSIMEVPVSAHATPSPSAKPTALSSQALQLIPPVQPMPLNCPADVIPPSSIVSSPSDDAGPPAPASQASFTNPLHSMLSSTGSHAAPADSVQTSAATLPAPQPTSHHERDVLPVASAATADTGIHAVLSLPARSSHHTEGTAVENGHSEAQHHQRDVALSRSRSASISSLSSNGSFRLAVLASAWEVSSPVVLDVEGDSPAVPTNDRVAAAAASIVDAQADLARQVAAAAIASSAAARRAVMRRSSVSSTASTVSICIEDGDDDDGGDTYSGAAITVQAVAHDLARETGRSSRRHSVRTLEVLDAIIAPTPHAEASRTPTLVSSVATAADAHHQKAEALGALDQQPADTTGTAIGPKSARSEATAPDETVQQIVKNVLVASPAPGASSSARTAAIRAQLQSPTEDDLTSALLSTRAALARALASISLDDVPLQPLVLSPVPQHAAKRSCRSRFDEHAQQSDASASMQAVSSVTDAIDEASALSSAAALLTGTSPFGVAPTGLGRSGEVVKTAAPPTAPASLAAAVMYVAAKPTPPSKAPTSVAQSWLSNASQPAPIPPSKVKPSSQSPGTIAATAQPKPPSQHQQQRVTCQAVDASDADFDAPSLPPPRQQAPGSQRKPSPPRGSGSGAALKRLQPGQRSSLFDSQQLHGLQQQAQAEGCSADAQSEGTGFSNPGSRRGSTASEASRSSASALQNEMRAATSASISSASTAGARAPVPPPVTVHNGSQGAGHAATSSSSASGLLATPPPAARRIAKRHPTESGADADTAVNRSRANSSSSTGTNDDGSAVSHEQDKSGQNATSRRPSLHDGSASSLVFGSSNNGTTGRNTSAQPMPAAAQSQSRAQAQESQSASSGVHSFAAPSHGLLNLSDLASYSTVERSCTFGDSAGNAGAGATYSFGNTTEGVDGGEEQPVPVLMPGHGIVLMPPSLLASMGIQIDNSRSIEVDETGMPLVQTQVHNSDPPVTGGSDHENTSPTSSIAESMSTLPASSTTPTAPPQPQAAIPVASPAPTLPQAPKPPAMQPLAPATPAAASGSTATTATPPAALATATPAAAPTPPPGLPPVPTSKPPPLPPLNKVNFRRSTGGATSANAV